MCSSCVFFWYTSSMLLPPALLLASGLAAAAFAAFACAPFRDGRAMARPGLRIRAGPAAGAGTSAKLPRLGGRWRVVLIRVVVHDVHPAAARAAATHLGLARALF